MRREDLSPDELHEFHDIHKKWMPYFNRRVKVVIEGRDDLFEGILLSGRVGNSSESPMKYIFIERQYAEKYGEISRSIKFDESHDKLFIMENMIDAKKLKHVELLDKFSDEN